MATQYSKTAADQKVIIDLKVNSRDAIDAIVAATDKITELKKQQKELEIAIKNGTASKDAKEQLVLIKSEISDLNTVVKANEKELQNNIAANKKAEDSLNAMRAQLKNMRAEYEDLSRADRESSFGQEMLKNIKSLTDEIKLLEREQGDATRGVGEYERALDGLQGQNARTALRELRMECQNLAVALNQTKGAITAQQQVVDSLAQTMGKDNQMYKDAVAELNRLNEAYQSTQDNLDKLEQEAGQMSDVLADSNARVKAFADDAQQIAAAKEGVTALTDAYTLLQGSLAALGLQSKSMLEIYAKIQVVQKSVNSLLAIYKALNKDSTLMVTARMKIEKARLLWQKSYADALKEENAATIANTAATKADAAAVTVDTVAKGAATTATFSLTAAMKALNTAIKANPFLAIAAVVVAAISGIIALVKKFRQEAKDAEEEAKRQIEETNKSAEEIKNKIKERISLTDSINKKYDEEIAKIKVLKSVIASSAESYEKKKQAMAELNRLIPEFNGKLDNTGKIIRGNMKAIDDYISKLEDKAKAEVATELMTQAYLKQASAQREKMLADQNKKWYESQIKMYQDIIDLQNSLEPRFRDVSLMVEAQKNLDWYSTKLEATKKVIKDVDAELAEANREIAATRDLVKDITPLINTGNKSGKTQKTEKKEDSEEVKAAKKLYEDLLKLRADYEAQFEKLRKAAITKQSEIENNRYAAEKKRMEKAIADAQALLDKAPMYDATGALVNDPEKLKALIEQYKQFLKEGEDAHQATLEKIKADTDAAYEDITKKLKYEVSVEGASDIELIQLNLAKELEALQAEEEQEIASHEYTEQQKAEITELYAEKRRIATENAAKAERDIWRKNTATVLSSMSTITGAMSDLYSQLAEDDASMQEFANGLAYIDIMVNMAAGIAGAVAAGSEKPFPYNLAAIAAGVAAVISGIGSAIALFNKNKNVKSAPKFSTGGPVGNKTTTRTDDTVDAKLSVGEYVIRSRVVKALGIDFFDALNGTKRKKPTIPLRFSQGGSVPSMTTIKETNLAVDYNEMRDVFVEAASEIHPVVSVKEINTVQSRVRVKEETAIR